MKGRTHPILIAIIGALTAFCGIAITFVIELYRDCGINSFNPLAVLMIVSFGAIAWFPGLVVAAIAYVLSLAGLSLSVNNWLRVAAIVVLITLVVCFTEAFLYPVPAKPLSCAINL
jgi:hypothetical protein